MFGEVLNDFELPDLTSEGFVIATKAKLSLDEDIQNEIENINQEPDEIFSLTKFIDTTPSTSVLGIAIPIVVGVVVLILIVALCCYCGLFTRKSPEERAKEEGLEETGFVDKDQESSKMLN